MFSIKKDRILSGEKTCFKEFISKSSYTSLGMFYAGLLARLTVIKPVLWHNKTVLSRNKTVILPRCITTVIQEKTRKVLLEIVEFYLV